MNTDQIEIVQQYLKIETNYAVIINGQYGVGKTHFYKNELAPKIKEISLSQDDRRKYIPIHISLFGFKSIEEIQTAIFVEIFPILKSKGVKLAAGIGKSIIRGIAQLNQAGDIDKYIGDISLEADDWLKYDELVICFDDLDRKSESLDLRDVFGFINLLVENQGAKILVIANEEQLIKDKNYSSNLREKVIGVSIQYKPDPRHVFFQIIESRYSSSSKVYFNFLQNFQNEIVSLVELNHSNFRNLIFFLEHFKTIFYPTNNLFQSDKDFAILKDDKLLAILNFTIAVSIEYKLGYLNSTNFEDVKKLGENPYGKMDFDSLFGNPTTKKDNEPEKLPYIDQFKRKYFSNNKYYFFKSIFEYITGIKAFNVDLLKAELENYFFIKDGEIQQQDIVLNKLSYYDCLKLSDKEYKELTLQMLSHLDEGKYHLSQFGTIFHFATRFDNMLAFNFPKLKKRFKKGIQKGKQNYLYNDDLAFYMTVGHDTEFKDDVIEIVKYCLEINNSLKESNSLQELENLFELFQSDYSAFIENVEAGNSEYRFVPFWLEFNINKTASRINKLNNEQIWHLGHYFSNRYRQHIYEKLFPEKDFITSLCQQLGKRITKRKGLHNVSLRHLLKCLQDSVKNFPT